MLIALALSGLESTRRRAQRDAITRTLVDAGYEVVPMPDGLRGRQASPIKADDFVAPVRNEFGTKAQKFGNPRPYLKRKKGRA